MASSSQNRLLIATPWLVTGSKLGTPAQPGAATAMTLTSTSPTARFMPMP